jgi:hypothetical protein
MPFQFVPAYLAQLAPGTDVAEALVKLLSQHRAQEEIVLSAIRCTWDRWGGDRQTEGQRQNIPVPESFDLEWARVLRDGADWILIHSGHIFEKSPADHIRYDPSNHRNHGWVAVGVEPVSSRDARTKRASQRPSAQPGPKSSVGVSLGKRKAKKPAYRELSKRVRAAIAKYDKPLSGLKTRRARAEFIAKKAKCSESLAVKVLRDEGK